MYYSQAHVLLPSAPTDSKQKWPQGGGHGWWDTALLQSHLSGVPHHGLLLTTSLGEELWLHPVLC